MPTENMQGILPGKVFIKENTDEIIKELQCYKFNSDSLDDKADAIKYAGQELHYKGTSMTVSISRKSSRSLQKMLGLERITRKRFKKLLMGCGMQRNDAEVIAEQFCNEKIPYTPLGVQQVIETIIKEIEEEQ